MKPVLPIDRGYVRVEWMQQTAFLFILQDFPQRPSATSGRTQRESRRRHYYAREDSDEEEAGPGSIQRDDRGGTWWRVTELMTVADSKLCLSALWKRSSQIKLSRQMLRSIRPKTIDTNELCVTMLMGHWRWNCPLRREWPMNLQFLCYGCTVFALNLPPVPQHDC